MKNLLLLLVLLVGLFGNAQVIEFKDLEVVMNYKGYFLGYSVIVMNHGNIPQSGKVEVQFQEHLLDYVSYNNPHQLIQGVLDLNFNDLEPGKTFVGDIYFVRKSERHGIPINLSEDYYFKASIVNSKEEDITPNNNEIKHTHYYSGTDLITSNFINHLLRSRPDNFIAKNVEGEYFKIDANDNGIIDPEEANRVGSIYAAGIGIEDISGVKQFTNLIELDCSNNLLSKLDISNNLKLKWLTCDNNQLSELKVDNIPSIENIICSYNKLQNLELTSNDKLRYLQCKNNGLTLLDISLNKEIVYLDCSNNNLVDLDTTSNLKLEKTFCHNNKLETLNVKNGVNGNHFHQMYSHGLGGYVYFYDQNYLGFSNNPLKYVCCDSDEVSLFQHFLKDVTIASNCLPTNISEHIADNNFTKRLLESDTTNTIAQDKFGNNIKIDANNNGIIENYEVAEIVSLDVSFSGILDLTGIKHFRSLQYLNCSGNEITTINLSNNTKIENLDVSSNKLVTLDLTSNEVIETVNLGDNPSFNNYIGGTTSLKNIISKKGVDGLINMDKSQLNKLQFVCVDNQDIITTNNHFDSIGKSTVLVQSDCSSFPPILNFESQAFKNVLLNSSTSVTTAKDSKGYNIKIDKNNDGEIDLDEALLVSRIDLGNASTIDDVSEISYFTNLTSFASYKHSFTKLDFSNNPKLVYVSVTSGALTEFDISNNPALTTVNFSNNKITILNLKNGRDDSAINLSGNPLTHICVDAVELDAIKAKVGSTVTVQLDCNTLSKTTIDLPTQVTTYPNPVKDQLNIALSTTAQLRAVAIYNLHGQLVLKSNSNTVDVSALPQGMYVVKVKTDQEEFTTRVIKE